LTDTQSERRETVIVQRIFHAVKQGRVDDFLALMKSNPDSVLNLATKRTYTSYIGRFNTVCHELEFESLDELDKCWAQWWADPETPAYMEKYHELTERGGSSEVWTLEE
jgi:hypothetical protein